MISSEARTAWLTKPKGRLKSRSPGKKLRGYQKDVKLAEVGD
jgi:hypothetical protein